MKMINAGKYNKRITIWQPETRKDSDDFLTANNPENFVKVLDTWAAVKTTRGMTIIASGSDFEKAYTNFTIRYPKNVTVTRKMRVVYGDRVYKIDYVNNIDEANVELELQCNEVTQ